MAQKEYIAHGKSYSEAVENGLATLGLNEDEVSIELVKAPSKGFLGIGGNSAEIKIVYDDGQPETVSVKPAAASDKAEVKAKTKKDRPAKVAVEKETHTDSAQDEVKGTACKCCGEADYNDIVNFASGLLEKMQVKNAGINIVPDDELLILDIVSEDSGFIIGRRGETLDALQYIVSLYANRHNDMPKKLVIDVENYRQKRREILENLAVRLAKSAIAKKRNVSLEPMQAYERRIIHATLQDMPEISTYSTGVDPYRKVVIAYKK